MKISKLILAIWLTASAWAQTPPPKPQPAPQTAAKPSGGQMPSPSQKTPAPAGKKAGAAAPSNAKAKPAEKPAKTPAQSSDKTAEQRKTAGKGVRDPFVSPIVEKLRTGANCTGSGRQCLLVGDINLQGVVRSPSGYIAVVTSGDHTYFLHDNDPLADGDVARISQDAITLRQRSTDVLGRPVVHEVKRKLGVPAA